MLKYQNENAVLNHLGVRREITVTYTMTNKVQATPAEAKEIADMLKANGAKNIKIK